MDFPAILRDLAVVMAIATAVALLFSKLRLSVIPAFLVAGVILGPTGAGLVSERGMVDALAEIGVALFLFTVGLDISVSTLGKMRRQVLWAGGAQVFATILLSLVIMMIFGSRAPEAMFVGFVVSLSSTAIVLKVYADRMETDTTQGRLSFGILLFQDMAAIPMMLLIPTLHQWETASASEVFVTLVKAAAGVTGLLLLARFLIPRLLKEIIRMNSREILAMTVLLVVLGTAYLAHRFGLSLGMGAFLAGMVISESDYVHEIAAQILPFRDVFNGIFFISVGMLLHLPFLFDNLLIVAAMVVCVAAVKAASAGWTVHALGYPWRVAVITGIGLLQIGELSFLLLSQGYRERLVDATQYQYLLSVTILTMMATPFLMNAAPAISKWWGKTVMRGKEFQETDEEAAIRKNGLENHVIIAGYGMNGRNLARVLKATRLPYAVVDLNDAQVREGRERGEPMFYGDVHRPEILDRLGIAKARILVLAISDPMATRRAVAIAKRSNPGIFILVRTRLVADVDDLIALGANAVIPEEFETSVEIFARVLAEYHVPDHVIRQQEGLIRSGTYKILRERGPASSSSVLAEFEEFLRRKVIEIYFISQGSGWEGSKVEDVPVGKDSGIVLLAILRGERALIQPSPSERLAAGDKLVLFGGHAPLAAALSAFARPPS
ncbi:MAG: cation:proton antiporter [Deltaproteobacteria bacterium]|nr:cation:proton antiporter [Deltaproteobacteria bacterium]